MKNKTTAIIVTFLRDAYLKECVSSLSKTYPNIDIMVSDNGLVNNDKLKYYKGLNKKGVKTFFLPFDTGITYGRNFLVKRVKTPYVLIGDDDFSYDKDTNLEAMISLLDSKKDIDIVCGRVREKGDVKNYQGNIDRHDDDSFHYSEMTLDNYRKSKGVKYKKVDIGFNFALMRTKIFKKILWDTNIKVAYEHSDFFIEATNKDLKTVFTPDAIVVHKPEHVSQYQSSDYKTYRYRKEDKDYFFNKWKINYIVDMKGNKSSR